MAKKVIFDDASADRIAEAVRQVEGADLSNLGPRPKKIRSGFTPAIPTESAVIIRDIPNPDGIELIVERAVRHPNYVGDESGQGGIESLGRYIARSELTGEEPVLEPMLVWFHTWARDYELHRWPTGAVTTRETEILTAAFRLGAWHVRLEFRPYLVETSGPVRVGSCHPRDQLEGLL